jgi:hypothetical protein
MLGNSKLKNQIIPKTGLPIAALPPNYPTAAPPGAPSRGAVPPDASLKKGLQTHAPGKRMALLRSCLFPLTGPNI